MVTGLVGSEALNYNGICELFYPLKVSHFPFDPSGLAHILYVDKSQQTLMSQLLCHQRFGKLDK